MRLVIIYILKILILNGGTDIIEKRVSLLMNSLRKLILGYLIILKNGQINIHVIWRLRVVKHGPIGNTLLLPVNIR